MLDVALLGTGGMMPLPNRFLTSLLCRYKGNLFLIDCGEGTQVTLKMLGWGFKNIGVICITHYHADHISGLPGMLLTIGNSGRTQELTIIGPKGLETVFRGLMTIAPELPFEVRLIELGESTENIFISDDLYISAVKAEHTINCFSYCINIRRKGKFDVEKACRLNIPTELWSVLQNEKEVIFENNVYTPQMVLGNERKGIKVCYCTDSRPFSGIVDFVRNADLFICEGMYGEDEKLDKAIEHKHMLFSEAGKIAAESDVSELWLTHFSPALKEPEEFSEFIKKIFPNTVIGYDRINKSILFDN